ncbi:methyltransferase domain-containing protein, partial [Mycobacterium tuberculosis]|nr:methyltransferase domain-containing protein [Mycobacterium tuberculosis]
TKGRFGEDNEALAVARAGRGKRSNTAPNGPSQTPTAKVDAPAGFDAVVAMHMLYHLADPAVGIAEMARVLKPGGTLLVTTNGVDNMRELYALAAALG